MSIDVVDLRTFYAQRLGTVARHFVGRGVRKHWSDTRGLRLLGVGYAGPYLGLFRDEAERCLAFMPAAQGVVKWPTVRPTLSALVDEMELPLPDAAVDRVLLVHALEMSQNATALLREIWRVLASGGQLLAVVPNRRGLWARMDTTPFGHGRPYSRSQITHLLREAWFTPVDWSEALYVPPIQRGWVLRSAGAWGAARAARAAMTPAAVTRIAVAALILVAVRLGGLCVLLRLRAGDEGRQLTGIGDRGGRLRLWRLELLRRRAVRLVLLRLMLRAALIMIRIRLLATVGLRLFARRIGRLLVVSVVLRTVEILRLL